MRDMRGFFRTRGRIISSAVIAAAIVLIGLPAVSPAAGEGVYHTVRGGDTLWGISRAYGISLRQLKDANEQLAESDMIRPGQKIFLASREGMLHRVKKGDTLWGISRAYGISLQQLRDANTQLAGRDMIRPGDGILIPGRWDIPVIEPLTRQVHEILRRGRSDRWGCIVIHHSATDTGSARIFDRYHRSVRGFRTMGYHFVVANGTDNTFDGEIQTGLRWIRQWDGAHTQGYINHVGIGICLVGNFENSHPTSGQMSSLLRLTAHLAYKYDIPLENIKGHKHFADNRTRCPGKNFPWDEFRRGLVERGIF